MEKLTNKQKAEVRKIAQKIKPSFQIGSAKIHDNNLKELNNSFNNKEIIKIKINRDDKYDKDIVKNIANIIESSLNVEICGIIGTVIIIYKKNHKISKENQLFV